jgi:hypothetical protein
MVCGCALRHGLVPNFPRWGKLPDAERSKLAAELKSARDDELLIVLIIHEGEGLLSVRVRKEKGEIVTTAEAVS